MKINYTFPKIKIKNMKEIKTKSEEYIKSFSKKASIILPYIALKRIPEIIKNIPELTSFIGKFVIFAPVGLIGFKFGKIFPDLDIKLLGIKNHRYFFFHSAIGLFILKKLYDAYLTKNGKMKKPDSIVKKILGVALSCGSFGVGIHLLIDVFEPKSVQFPFFGSLIDATMIDDKIYLLGNALWCFVIAKDTFVLALGDDLNKVKEFVYSKYSSLISDFKAT